jgi:hypothetical protein
MKMGNGNWFIAAVLISIVAFTIDDSLAQDEKTIYE